MDTFRGFTQSFLVCIDGGLRNIENGDVLVSAGEEVIDQCGFTTADINDGYRASRSRLFYKPERCLKVRTVPTDCVRGFLCVDLLPVGLCVHTDQCPRVTDFSSMIGLS
jgi:hypothetical protein